MPNPPFPDAAAGQSPQLWHIQDFAGINTQSRRPAIADQEFAWLQNYMPIGSGNMRTLWSNGPNVYTVPDNRTIVYMKLYNLASIVQAAVIFNDGTAVQVNPSTSATTVISSAPGQFYEGGNIPAIAQWNSSGIVIVTEANYPNGYYAWDGSTLYLPGQNAPDWLTDQTPTVMPSGVHGVAIETYQGRAWVAAPPESGGIPPVLFNSGGGNGANFSTTSGGGAVPQQDASLTYTFTGLKQTNGFLYYFGDSSVGVISNIQVTTNGSTLSTTYSNVNVDPQKGTPWRSSIRQFTTPQGPGILFANPQGIHILLGGTATKVSGDLDGLFAEADFLSLTPSAGVGIIYGITVYCLLFKTLDQNGNQIVVMAMTDGKRNARGDGFRWWLASQTAIPTFITFNEIDSNLEIWGTDGKHIFQLFTTPSATLPKTIQTKFFPGSSPTEYIVFKKLFRFYFQAIDNAGTGVAFDGTFDSDYANTSMVISSLTAVNSQGNALQAQNIQNQNLYPITFGVISAGSAIIIFINNSGGVIQFVNSGQEAINFSVSSLLIPGIDASCYGRLIGASLGSTSQDFTLVALTMLYSFDAPYLG